MTTLGTRCLVADLALAGVAPDVRRDALAGDFDPWTGTPEALAGRAPAWIADAVAVRAYAVSPPAAEEPAPAPAPPRVLLTPPTARQLEVLAALRQLIDAGIEVTRDRLRRTVRERYSSFDDLARGLLDRQLVRILPGRRPIYVLGPRAYLYPERIPMRTQRSLMIERLLREGRDVDEILGQLEPRATRAEVYRVRASYCRDLPVDPGPLPTGEKAREVVELLQAGWTNLQAIAHRVGLSHPRVREIVDRSRRLGEVA